ncbi:MAG: hypothetical protein H0X30_00080 [Anaerolineae bacterium]|nr:hypothetical protein [Anaerolineae bacterium]
MTQTTFSDNVLVDGSQDIKQLRVQGHTAQTQQLQTWEDSAGNTVAQVTGDGRLIVGDDDATAQTPDSLIEAHRFDTSTSKPKRGIHSLGQVTGTLNALVQWMVGELELTGASAISALHTALRVRASNKSTVAGSAGAEVRGADIEVINDALANAAAFPKATGLQVAVTNASSQAITDAIGLKVKLSGTITNPFSIYTEGPGPVHLEDYMEVKRPAATPGTPATDFVRIYSKSDGKLYAKDWNGVEYDLTAASGGGSSPLPSICNGRLTLTTGVPVTNADVTAAVTLYFTPLGGNQLTLYNGSAWVLYSFTERSLSLTGLLAATNYDIFVYDNAGTLTLEALAWTSGTVRATALVKQDGVYVKTGALGRRYLGTIRTVAAGQTEDSKKKRLVYNEYNRFIRNFFVSIAVGSWTYATNAWRAANADATARAEVVIGNVGPALDLNLVCRLTGSGAGITQGIGIDTTTANSADLYVNIANDGDLSGQLVHQPAIGYHYYQWIENGRGVAGSAIYFGLAAGAYSSGLNGSVIL